MSSITRNFVRKCAQQQYFIRSKCRALSYNFSSTRSISVSPNLLKKSEDPEDDKNKKFKEIFETLKEDWICLSPLGKAFLSATLLGLFFIFLDTLGISKQEIKSTTTINKFLELLSKNQVTDIKYNKFQKCLYFKNTDSMKTEIIADLSLKECQSYVKNLYDSIDLRFVDRQIIQDDKNGEGQSWIGGLAGYSWSGFSNYTFAWFCLLYFLILTPMRTRRGHHSPLSNFMNQNRGNSSNSSKKSGKNGKKNNNSNSRGGGGFFGSAQAGPNSDLGSIIEPDDIDTGFKDVAGCEEAKIEVIEIVDFLRNKSKYVKAGAEVPKGAIFHGPPGTGKTLLAKACAKEAGVTFIQCSGSDFIEMYVGMGSKRVRNLFEKARDNAPSILFIDEIDSVGSSRAGSGGGGGGGGGGSSEHNQTINSILAEMDGFNTGNVPVVVMAATNLLDNIDAALLRPGRFDRKIYVGSPDVEGRMKIFNVHLQKINTKEKNKNELAKYLAVKTPGMAGAEIKNICNEAALHSVRNGDDKVTKENFDKAIDRVIAGLEKTNSLIDPRVKKRIAIHEAGHAVTSWFLKNCMPLVKVTITPRTEGALGFALYQPDTNNVLQEKDYFLDQMTSTLAGRAAEEVFYNGSVSSGAHDDLKKVTRDADLLIRRLGMGETIKNVNFQDNHHISTSEKTREIIDQEIQFIITSQYDRAINLVIEKKDLIEKMAEKLMEKETLNREDVIEILGERPFEDNMTFEAQTKHSSEGEFVLPPGLKHWERSFRYKNEGSSKTSKTNTSIIGSTTSKEEEETTSNPTITSLTLPTNWEEQYDSDSGIYYINTKAQKTSMRHPGKILPKGWVEKVDEEGRCQFVHEKSGYVSWSLENDMGLSEDLRKEIEEFERGEKPSPR